MDFQAQRAYAIADSKFEPSPVSVRTKISGLWAAIPSLMVFAVLVMRAGVSRIVNLGLSVVYALTIIAGAIGEWNYYLFGSAVEVALLALIFYYAWTWPRATET